MITSEGTGFSLTEAGIGQRVAGAPAGRLLRRVRVGQALTSPTLLAAVGAAAVLPLVARIQRHHAPSLGPAVATMITLCALAAVWLLCAQYRRSRLIGDLLAVAAVATLALMNLWLSMLPAALDLDAARQLRASMLWGQLFVAATFALAAFVRRDRWVVAVPAPLGIVFAVGLGAVTLSALAGFVLPSADVGPGVGGSGPVHHPVGLAIVLTAIALLAAAALSPAARKVVPSLEQSATLATAAALLAAADVYQLLLASPRAGELPSSDIPTLAAVGLMLFAAARNEPRARVRAARAAAVAERRRVAQDLHDGLAQDLAFIAAHGSVLADGMGEEHPMVIAARRALAISRSTISDLSDPSCSTVGESLEALAQDLRDRFDITIVVDCQVGDELNPDAREHVARIAREAIANAARHGEARNVVLSLTRVERALILRVVDDGCGIAAGPDGPAPEGFGLRSMRERAAALGGYLTVRQPRWGGTQLEVVFR